VVKIGFTLGQSDERAKELSQSTSIPLDFEVAEDWLTEAPQLVEKLIHKELKRYRVSSRKEFFRLSTDEARNVINRIVYGFEDNVIDISVIFQHIRYLLNKYRERFNVEGLPQLLNEWMEELKNEWR
jgi:hypothetical protein